MNQNLLKIIMISCWATLLLTGCNSKEKSFTTIKDEDSGKVVVNSIETKEHSKEEN